MTTRRTLRSLAAGAIAGLTLASGALALAANPAAADPSPVGTVERSSANVAARDANSPVSATGSVTIPELTNSEAAARQLRSQAGSPKSGGQAPRPEKVSFPKAVAEAIADETAPESGAQTANAPTEGVIGADQRKIVANTMNTASWKTTVLIYDYSTNGWCTGFMIGPDTVATAGHCVYTRGKGWWSLSQTKVFPAYNGYTNTAPFGSCGVRNMHTVNGWINSGSFDYDYGAIKLNCKVGNQTGWYGLTSTGYSTSTRLDTQGYPSDKRPSLSMWHTTGTTTGRYGAAQLLTTMDIIQGQSGSPLYRVDAGCPRCAVGIVSWESPNVNGANQLNNTSINFLLGVRNYV